MWRFFIELFIEGSYGDFVEDDEVPGDGLPVCSDPTVAKDFESIEELEEWVSNSTSLKKANTESKGSIIMITLRKASISNWRKYD